jgi:hypothetical protein
MNNQDEPGRPRGGIPTRTAEIVVAAVFVAFGSIVAYDSYRLGARWAPDGPQSGYFPFYIGAIIAAASLITLVQALLGKAEGNGGVFVEWHRLRPVMAVLVPAVVYVLGVQLIGIYIASVLYIAAFMVWLGNYSRYKASAVSVIVIVILYLMFEVWFKVPLYRGSYDLLGLVGL